MHNIISHSYNFLVLITPTLMELVYKPLPLLHLVIDLPNVQICDTLFVLGFAKGKSLCMGEGTSQNVGLGTMLLYILCECLVLFF